jgi:hypothetical protein
MSDITRESVSSGTVLQVPARPIDRVEGWVHLGLFGFLAFLASIVLMNLAASAPPEKRLGMLYLPVLGVVALLLYGARPLLSRQTEQVHLEPERLVLRRQTWFLVRWSAPQVSVPLAGIARCQWDATGVWVETTTGRRIVLLQGHLAAVHESLYERVVEHLERHTLLGSGDRATEEPHWTARLAPVPHPRWPVESEAERLRVRFALEVPHPVKACLRERDAWILALCCGVGMSLLGLLGLVLLTPWLGPSLGVGPVLLLALGIPLAGEAGRKIAQFDPQQAVREAARLTIALEASANAVHRTDANGQTEVWTAAQVRDLEVTYHHEPGGEGEDGHQVTLLLHPHRGLTHELFTTRWYGERYDPDVVHAELSWLAYALKQRLHEESGRAESEGIQSSLLRP